ncbi:MAG TPA: hypothetical protein VF054_13970 [Micromonosporaceae bacterium]
MGTASAIPEHLYSYSDQCTHSAQELQNWVRAVLRPALEAYLRGSAQSTTDGVNIDTSAVTARAGSIETELPKRISEAYYTDREVRRVGLAFQVAGGHGALDGPSATPITSTDDAVDKGLSSYDAGAAAAAQLKFYPIPGDVDAVNPDGWYKPIFSILDRNADNPEFCQGLLEAGGPSAVQNLLRALASGQFHDNLMNPASGPISEHTAQEILTKIFRNGLANPQIAAELGPSLPTVIPSVLAEVHPHWRQVEAYRQLLPVITTIMSQLRDPQVALHLTKAIGEGIPKDFSASDLRGLMPELRALMSMGVSHGITPWGKGERLETWAERYGKQTADAVAPYLAAMQAADMAQNERNDLLKSMFQGAYLNLAFMPLDVIPGSDLAVSVAAAGALQSWVGAKDPTNTMGLGHYLKDTNPNLDILTLNNLIDAKAGHFAMISMLLEKGYIRDPDLKGDHPLRAAGGHQDVDQVLKIAANPDRYYIVGSRGDRQVQLSVDQLIHDFNSGAGYLDPKSKIYQLLTKQ